MSVISPKRVALIVGGGPAPGINGVISAATIEAINQGAEVWGIMDGYKWLVEEESADLEWLQQRSLVRRMGMEDIKNVHTADGAIVHNVRNIHIRGGSILRTSRTNPTKKPEYMARVLKVFRQMNLDSLVTIGGDDTAYSASQVYKSCKEAGGYLRVAHVPKTIDNDLPLHESMPTFGFETARQVGTHIVRNLAEDARTTSRWFIVVSMGRAAGHLALGIGKASAATLTIIPEEFRDRYVTLDEIRDIILGSIIKRKAEDRHHGVVVLAEGLLEAIGAETLKEEMGEEMVKYGSIDKDQFDHLRLGEIDFGRMMKDLLQKEIDKLNEQNEELDLNIRFVDKEIGYEMRCADPIPFDAEYTRDLGYGAVKFLRSEQAAEFGAIISYAEGQMVPLRFEDMLSPETKKMRTRKVNVHAEGYECARRYMIRLEEEDFEKPDHVKAMAETLMMTAEDFRRRFGYLVGSEC